VLGGKQIKGHCYYLLLHSQLTPAVPPLRSLTRDQKCFVSTSICAPVSNKQSRLLPDIADTIVHIETADQHVLNIIIVTSVGTGEPQYCPFHELV